jgi:hypothetical protein
LVNAWRGPEIKACKESIGNEKRGASNPEVPIFLIIDLVPAARAYKKGVLVPNNVCKKKKK